MKTPKGFTYAGLNVGIKVTRKDMALVVSEVPCVAAGCFTVNKSKAAPVVDAEARLPGRGISAIVINSGNANALTGPEGTADVGRVHQAFAKALGTKKNSILSASTGVIGVRLPVQKLIDAAPRAKASLGPSIESAAEAIMTTDTRMKLAGRVISIPGADGVREVTIAAIAKGSGMIAPQLATMIAVLCTDAAISPSALQAVLSRSMDESFNQLTVDGDMSTNDAVFALANGLAENPLLDEDVEGFREFEDAVRAICVELARAIAEDGEGATKLVEVTITGAPDAAIGRDLARSVAGSSLVKAAIFGADPNWGRVLSTIGARAGSQRFPVDPMQARVSIQGVVVFENGAPTGSDAVALRAKMRLPQVAIEVALAEGETTATAWGCDLSYDYVKINADYTSLTSSNTEGTVAKDDRLTNYTPGFKRALLVEALSYISRFTGTRAVVKYGGAAMVKDSLKASFAGDINLLRSAGLLPIVVHGGGPEINRTLEKLDPERAKSEFVDGVRITDSADLKVVEMVLTGRINTELVSLLNHGNGGAHAVGVSGKDGGLLRARKLLGEGGRDLGRVGEVTSVNADLLELLLGKHYVPVISPVGLGDDGEGYNINADAAAAEVAIALKAEKLIYLTDVAGIMQPSATSPDRPEHSRFSGPLEADPGWELISEISAAELRDKIARGVVRGGMVAKARSILRAIDGGVRSVHVVDGRTPHGLVAELFTDRGVGTLVTA